MPEVREDEQFVPIYGDEAIVRKSFITDVMWRIHGNGRGMTHSGPTWMDCPHSLCIEAVLYLADPRQIDGGES